MIRLAVIGTGVMGSHHVRILKQMTNVDLVSISDTDKDKLDKLSSQYNIKKIYVNHLEMLEKEKLDGVVVAVPPSYHKKIVLDCFKKGLNVLVEKPIAHSVEDAKEMIKAADMAGTIFTVGHVERFNPVVTKIKEFIDQGMIGKIYLVNSVRIGPFPKRLYGMVEGVLIDLAVHDVDIIRYLSNDITQVVSQLIFSGKQEIYAQALFNIKGNIKGSSAFSWVSPKKMREIEVLGMKGTLRGDYINQELRFYENSDDTDYAIRDGKISEGKMIKFPIWKQEPLKVELEHFVECIEKRKQPLVEPLDALKALEVALAIYESGISDKSIKL